MIERKNPHSGHQLRLQKSRLLQEQSLALKRGEYNEVADIKARLAELNAKMGVDEAEEADDDAAAKFARINERNRKANLQASRNAELREAERKRRERKLAASGAATPKTDPSARLKTVPKLVISRSVFFTNGLTRQVVSTVVLTSPSFLVWCGWAFIGLEHRLNTKLLTQLWRRTLCRTRPLSHQA